MSFWNPWHGCHKVSTGCLNCYVYRRDSRYGKDSSVVTKTSSYDLPLKMDREGHFKLTPEDGVVYTCFTSDFFVEDADEWRTGAWKMMRYRSDLHFFLVTKRPERIARQLPPDWGDGYDNVTIVCTCENQKMADKRLPIFLELPLKHRQITHEPMLEPINLRLYLEKYADRIETISCGGESGPDARICDYSWILGTLEQCKEFGVSFYFHQTGANFKKGNRRYHIDRKLQGPQARKAGIDYAGCKRTI